MGSRGLRQAPHDPVLANLPDLFPAHGAPEFVCQAARATMGIEVEAAQGEVRFVRYRPGRSCTVLWSFPGVDGSTVLLSGRLFRDERGARILEQAPVQRRMDEVTDASRQNRPCHYVREERLLLQAFPMDMRLPGLARAGSEAWMDDRLLPALGMIRKPNQVMAAKVRSYKPWERCVFDYVLGDGACRKHYFAKLLWHQQGHAVLGRLQALKAQLSASGARWQIAAPLVHLRKERMLVASAIGGGSKLPKWLRAARKNEGVRIRLLEQVAWAAQGLRSFQQASPGPLRTVSPRDLLEELQRHTESVRRVAPELASRMEKTLRALGAALERLVPEPMVPTHGAFRLDHLLPVEGGVGVLDLDTLCRSGISADAGNFLAYLESLAVRRPRLQSLLRECASAFSDALPPGSADRGAWLSWYHCASLVKIATRGPLLLAPDWCESSHALIGRAEERLAPLSCPKGLELPTRRATPPACARRS